MFLSYLNQGGDPETLETHLNAIPVGDQDTIHAALQVANLNNDGIPDILAWLLVPGPGNFVDTMIYGFVCVDHRYQTAFMFQRSPFERFTSQDGYHLLAVLDMNGNRIQDVVIYFRAAQQYTVWILEWNGEAMTSLIPPMTDPMLYIEVQYVQFLAGKDRPLAVKDLNGDGLVELVITRDTSFDDAWPHCSGATDVWAWDGSQFRLDCSLTAP